MMGLHRKQDELWCEPVNLARRIPPDHALRRLQRVLDLDFVPQEVSRCYGRNGNVSVDPVIVLKMMLLLFWDNVASERELLRIIPLRIDYLWFLGYNLEDEIPHHSVLSKARKRWGGELFSQLFGRVVQQCWDAGLVDGAKLHADSSLIRADAAVNSVVRVTLAKLDEPETNLPTHPTNTREVHTTPVNGRHLVQTDPDSAVARHRTGKAVPSYKNHRLVDDKKGVVTVSQTTHGVVDDGVHLPALLAEQEQRVPVALQTLVADARYGSSANFLALARKGVQTHMADLRSKQRNLSVEGIHPREDFTYQAASDTYQCPAGEVLVRHHFHHHRGYWEYRAATEVCAGCPQRAQCTRSRTGRSINRYPEQELLDEARRQSHSEAGKLDRKRRQWFQERNFAEASTQHGYKRARWRGLWRQTIQDQIIATLQNLKILMRNLFAAFCGLWRALPREWEDLTTFMKGFLLNDPRNNRHPNASNIQSNTA